MKPIDLLFCPSGTSIITWDSDVSLVDSTHLTSCGEVRPTNKWNPSNREDILNHNVPCREAIMILEDPFSALYRGCSRGSTVDIQYKQYCLLLSSYLHRGARN